MAESVKLIFFQNSYAAGHIQSNSIWKDESSDELVEPGIVALLDPMIERQDANVAKRLLTRPARNSVKGLLSFPMLALSSATK
jgi:hypothetical protein